MKVVVSDTGPLLHLNEIGAARLVQHLGAIYVTPTVLNELRRHTSSAGLGEMLAWLNLREISPSVSAQAAVWEDALVLHAGEAEALAYAREIKADMFLTDDTAARTLAEALGMHVRGSLGVVLFAAASGCLDRIASLNILSDLEKHSTLWMSAKVKAAARQAISTIFGDT